MTDFMRSSEPKPGISIMLLDPQGDKTPGVSFESGDLKYLWSENVRLSHHDLRLISYSLKSCKLTTQ